MPLKVLVVDDATFVRDMVKRTVRQLLPGVELYEATDGERAVAVIKSKAPDLILSDWEMPEMSGDDLLRWVRGQPQSADTPFIMITSRGDRNHVIAAVSAGVSDYLSKPFTPEELTNKIVKQLRRMKHPMEPAKAPANNNLTSTSVDLLTSGRSPLDTTTATESAKRSGSNFKGSLKLRFSHTISDCVVREISLQAMGGTIIRPEQVPSVFDQASVDLLNPEGQTVARINAYVHSVTATEPNPDAKKLRIIVRFVDQDPVKLQALSQLLG